MSSAPLPLRSGWRRRGYHRFYRRRRCYLRSCRRRRWHWRRFRSGRAPQLPASAAAPGGSPKQRDLDGAVVGRHGGGVGQPRRRADGRSRASVADAMSSAVATTARPRRRGAGVVEALQRRLRRAQRVALGGEDVQGLRAAARSDSSAEVRRAASARSAPRAAASAPSRADSPAAAASAPSARAAARAPHSEAGTRGSTRAGGHVVHQGAARAAMDASRASEASDDDDRPTATPPTRRRRIWRGERRLVVRRPGAASVCCAAARRGPLVGQAAVGPAGHARAHGVRWHPSPRIARGCPRRKRCPQPAGQRQSTPTTSSPPQAPESAKFASWCAVRRRVCNSSEHLVCARETCRGSSRSRV